MPPLRGLGWMEARASLPLESGAEGDCLPAYFVTFYAVWISQGEASDVMQS